MAIKDLRENQEKAIYLDMNPDTAETMACITVGRSVYIYKDRFFYSYGFEDD